MDQSWRFIPEVMAPGSTQMATDAWLLDQLIMGQQPPTLRFYRWQPVALSLGYHQNQWPSHWRSLRWREQAIELVRRPSGGRAVLHQGDLTYAVTMPLQKSRQDLYRQICDALIAAWKRLGVSLDYGTARRRYHTQASCFALATAADLVTPTGYKLVGSAQWRRDGNLLQHGSIRLWPDAALYTQVFGQNPETSANPPTVIPKAPDREWVEHLSTMIMEELGQSLGITYDVRSLNEAEHQQITQWQSSFVIPVDFSPKLVASSPEDIALHP